MQQKQHSKQLGATAATTVRLTEPYHETDKIETADSQLGSVKAIIKANKAFTVSCL